MDALTKIFTDRRITGIPWLLLRLFIGYLWLDAGLHKVGAATWTGDQAPSSIHGFLMGALAKTTGERPSVYAWYGDFINNVALPNELLFSYLVAYGEVLVGVALLLGLFSKWAAFWGVVMNLSFLLAGTTSSNGYMLAAQMAMLFGGLGVSFYGLDTFVLPFAKKQLLRVFGKAPAPALAPETQAVS
jgi:thiosulfate dehydrogenase [quinone] large subunit